MQPTRIAGLFGVLLLAGAGCSNSGGVVPPAPLAASRSVKAHVKITEFADLPVYSDYYGPSGIASGPEHSLWVTDYIDQDFGENAVVQVATSGKALNTFYYGGRTSEGSDLVNLTEGRDGALWICDEYNAQILRMTTAGSFTSYSPGNSPWNIVSGPDRALWFTASGGRGDEIGRITTQGQITLYSASSLPWDIAAGSDGALWYTEPYADAIARITTHGKTTVYTKGISAGAYPYSIAAGRDGALWFTELKGGRIGRITTAGQVTEYSSGITPSEEPVGIAAGPDGALWFTEYESNSTYRITNSKIGRITTGGKIAEYSKGLTAESGPGNIVAGPDGNMWFVEGPLNKTGRAAL